MSKTVNFRLSPLPGLLVVLVLIVIYSFSPDKSAEIGLQSAIVSEITKSPMAIAFILSELLSLLPFKAKGLFQALKLGIQWIGKKKWLLNSQSR